MRLKEIESEDMTQKLVQRLSFFLVTAKNFWPDKCQVILCQAIWLLAFLQGF